MRGEDTAMMASTQNKSFCRVSEREGVPMITQAPAPTWLELSFAAAVFFIGIMGIIDVIFVVLFIAAMVNR